MNKMFDIIAGQAEWILPLICILIWFAIDSRWEAYTRRKNYEELKLLNDLREKNIITQAEFDEKKEALLSV